MVHVHSLFETYTNILDNNNLKYDVVYWRRYNIEEKIFCNKLFAYNVFQNDEINKLIKLKNMFGYANYVKKLIKQKNYNKIIILSTLPGVLLENYLVKFKKHEYILDIRDAELKDKLLKHVDKPRNLAKSVTVE